VSQVPSNPVAALVLEWVQIAEADLDMARRESGAQRPHLDQVGFLYQQATEKLMKAVLTKKGVTPPKTHDLEVLDQLLGQFAIGPTASVQDLLKLSAAAVRFRYPGPRLTPANVADLQRIAHSIWTILRPLV